MKNIATIAAIAAAPAIAATAAAEPIYTLEFGHAHVALGFGENPADPRDRDDDPTNNVEEFLNDDGGAFIHFGDSSSAPPSNLPVDGPYGPGQVNILVSDANRTARPDFAELDAALGNAAGDDVWILPELLQTAVDNNVPWLSPEVEEEAYEVFDDPDNDPLTGNVRWTLDAVSGPGEVALWIADPSDPFGGIQLWHGSADGLDASDGVDLLEGDTHNNWAFTQPGVYDLTFTFSGLIDGVTVSDTGTFRFTVVPAPGTAALAGFAAFAATRRRR